MIFNEGDSILVLEAIKIEVQVSAPVGRTITDIDIKEGKHIVTGQVLATIN